MEGLVDEGRCKAIGLSDVSLDDVNTIAGPWQRAQVAGQSSDHRHR